MVWYYIGVYIINRTLHGLLEIRNFSLRVEKYFTRSLCSLVKQFSTLGEKFPLSAWSCNILYVSDVSAMYKLKLERSKDLPLSFFLFNGTVIPLERSAPVGLTIITCNPEGYQSDAMLVFFLLNMFTISFKLINSNSEFSQCSFLSYGTNHPFQLL